MSGEEIIITKAVKPTAKLINFKKNKTRKFGILKNKIKIADDFDESLSESILADFNK